VKRYWETVQNGEFNTTVRAFALAEISVPEFEKTKREYFERLAGNSEMKVILNEVGKRQRDNILGPPAAAAPAPTATN
jgi:hypothetical protein